MERALLFLCLPGAWLNVKLREGSWISKWTSNLKFHRSLWHLNLGLFLTPRSSNWFLVVNRRTACCFSWSISSAVFCFYFLIGLIVAGGYVIVPEKLPNYVVPDLTDFKVLFLYLSLFSVSRLLMYSTWIQHPNGIVNMFEGIYWFVFEVCWSLFKVLEWLSNNFLQAVDWGSCATTTLGIRSSFFFGR